MSRYSFLAIDLDIETDRISLGILENGILILKEIHRFHNHTVKIQGEYHWDLQLIFAEVVHGLMLNNEKISSIAVTSWGADYGLLDAAGEIIGLPFSHRDARTVGMMEEVFKQIPAETIFQYTGLQPEPVNTLFQLFAHAKNKEAEMNRAFRLLFIPDLLNYYLTGKVQTEFTIASTSQMLHRETQTWCMPLVDLVWLPNNIPATRLSLKAKREARNRMPKEFKPCQIIGPLTPTIAARTGLNDIAVVAVGSHKTASAVAAIPAEGSDWAYIIADSITLIGVETMLPVMTIDAMGANFTNEGGVEGTNLFQKKLSGHSLVEDCRQEWYKHSTLPLDAIWQMSLEAPAFDSFIDPDHFSFIMSGSKPEAIRGFCMKTGQNIPTSHAQIIRIILESLAMKFRLTVDEIRKLTGRTIQRLHITGSGSDNEVLCQFIANACAIQVIAGPVQTTTIGNILCQARTFGYLKSLDDIRSVAVHSFKTKEYQPNQTHEWDKARIRFQSIIR